VLKDLHGISRALWIPLTGAQSKELCPLSSAEGPGGDLSSSCRLFVIRVSDLNYLTFPSSFSSFLDPQANKAFFPVGEEVPPCQGSSTDMAVGGRNTK
jgi:hypothetical protein